MSLQNINPVFGAAPVLGRARLAAAVTPRDGSGSLGLILRDDGTTWCGGRKYYSATADATTDRFTITVPDSSKFESDVKFEIVSGTPPTGTALNTKYKAINIVWASATSVTFQVMSLSTYAVLDLTSTGTLPVLAFDTGSYVTEIRFTSAQATAAASSAMVGKTFISDNAGANFRILAETTLPTLTPSTTVIGQTQSFLFPTGLKISGGCQIGVAISVYASAADQYDVLVFGGDY